MSDKSRNRKESKFNLSSALEQLLVFFNDAQSMPRLRNDAAISINALDWMMKHYDQTQKIIGFLKRKNDIGDNNEIGQKEFWNAVKNITDKAPKEGDPSNVEEGIAWMIKRDIVSLNRSLSKIRLELVENKTNDILEKSLISEARNLFKKHPYEILLLYTRLDDSETLRRLGNTGFAVEVRKGLEEIIDAKRGAEPNHILKLPENLEFLQKQILSNNEFQAERAALAEMESHKELSTSDKVNFITHNSSVFSVLLFTKQIIEFGKNEQLFGLIKEINDKRGLGK